MNKQTVHNSGFSQEEMAQLFNYPALEELFSDYNSNRLDEFRAKLNKTRENLERIIRYGKSDEAENAQQVVRAIEVTLEFLQTLQNRSNLK